LMDQLSPVSAIDNPAWTSPPDVIGDAVWWDFRLPDPQLGLPVTKSSTIVFAPYKTFGPAYPLRNVATWTARWDDGTEETRTVSDWVYVVEPGTDPRGLAVVKTLVSPASGAVVRDTLEYEISVTNVTGEIMSAVAVTDTYPSSCMTLQRADPAPSSVASGVVVWDGIGPLGPGDTWRAELMFHADAPCSQALNCVEARAPGPRATYLVGADCAPTDIGGGAPSLRVSKRRTSPSPVAVGDPVDWQITVTNVGGAPASWVVLRDRCKPDGLAFLTASPAPDAVDPQTGQLDWNDLGSLAPGASHTVDVSMQAVGAGPGWQNCADVTYLANGGIEVRSDCDIVDVVAQGPAIRVTKVRVWPAASAAVAVSDTVAFSLTVRNVGSVPLSMVDLLDTFDPARLEYLRPPMAGSHQPAPGSVLWDLDPLQPGASASRLASFRVLSAGGSAINCARASGESATGPRVEDTACVELWTEEPEPGVTVRKSALGLADLPQTGDVLHFQIVVQNTGNTTLLQVPLEEGFIGECLEFVTATPWPDWVDPLGGRLRWLDLGPLAPGEAHTVDVMLRAAQSCWPLENCASTAALDIGLRQLTATDCALVWVGEGPAVPLYLPLVFKEWTSSTAPPVPTPTSSPTATGSPAATATATASPTASATPPSGETVVVPPGSTLILDQDFSGGTLDGWTPTSGIWEVGRGYMAGELFEGLCWNMRSEVAGDLLYQGRVCACSGAHDVGLVFRASADGSAGYEASVDVVDGVFRLVKRSPYEVLASYPTEAGWLGTWYDVAVLADGPHIEAYLDGVKRLDVTDGSYASGHLGVVVDRAVGHFDDLRAWSLP